MAERGTHMAKSSNYQALQTRYLRDYVVERISNGSPPEQILKLLVQNGLTAEQAGEFLTQVEDEARQERMRAGLRSMFWGLLLAGLGGGIWAALHHFVQVTGVVVAPIGLIAWGGWTAIKGLGDYLDNQTRSKKQG